MSGGCKCFIVSRRRVVVQYCGSSLESCRRESRRPPAVSSDPDKSLPASRGPVLVLSQLSPSASNKQTNSCGRRCGGGRPRVLGQWAGSLAGAEHKAGAAASELINWVNSSSSCFSMLMTRQTAAQPPTHPFTPPPWSPPQAPVGWSFGRVAFRGVAGGGPAYLGPGPQEGRTGTGAGCLRLVPCTVLIVCQGQVRPPT